MSSPRPLRTTDARLAARAHAAEAGIDRALISNLVETFYGHVRNDPDLGPIFQSEIGGSWGHHLETMKTFWDSITFHDGVYSGRPMPAHMKLTGLTPRHFETWLRLFSQTLEEIGASGPARQFFEDRAQRIAQSFQLHIFSSP